VKTGEKIGHKNKDYEVVAKLFKRKQIYGITEKCGFHKPQK